MGAAMSPCLLPLLVLVLLKLTTAAQAECAAGQGQELVLALAYATNATGHPHVEALLDQPLSGGWVVRVEVTAAACGPGGVPRRSLALSLHGPPGAGGLLVPSLRKEVPQRNSPTPSPASTPTPRPAPRPASRPAPTPSRSPPPPNYITLRGLGYYRAPYKALNWVSAGALCREEGGELAVPTSRREAEELVGRFPRNAVDRDDSTLLWIGVSDMEEEGKFVTDDGVPLEDTGFAEFASGQPSGKRNENCLAIYTDRSLHDVDCSLKLPFVCKVPF